MNMNMRIALFCLLGGLCFTISAMGAGHFGWWYVSGLLTVAALVPVVRFGPRGMVAQGVTMFVMLVLIGLVCTLSEGVVFFPEKKAQMIAGFVGGSVLYLIVAVVLAVLAKLLKLRKEQNEEIAHRSVGMAIPMVLLAAFSYLVYYEIFGAITYQFFTKGYYPHAVEQVSAMGAWFFGYQIARGLVMTLVHIASYLCSATAALAGCTDRGFAGVGDRRGCSTTGSERDDGRHAALHPHRGDLHAEFPVGRDSYFAYAAAEAGLQSRLRCTLPWSSCRWRPSTSRRARAGLAGVEEGVPAAGSLDLVFSLDSAGLESPEDSDEESELLDA